MFLVFEVGYKLIFFLTHLLFMMRWVLNCLIDKGSWYQCYECYRLWKLKHLGLSKDSANGLQNIMNYRIKYVLMSWSQNMHIIRLIIKMNTVNLSKILVVLIKFFLNPRQRLHNNFRLIGSCLTTYVARPNVPLHFWYRIVTYGQPLFGLQSWIVEIFVIVI